MSVRTWRCDYHLSSTTSPTSHQYAYVHVEKHVLFICTLVMSVGTWRRDCHLLSISAVKQNRSETQCTEKCRGDQFLGHHEEVSCLRHSAYGKLILGSLSCPDWCFIPHRTECHSVLIQTSPSGPFTVKGKSMLKWQTFQSISLSL